jgi:hypothetical protein
MSLSPETKTAVLRRFVTGQRARRRRSRLALVVGLVAVLVAVGFAVSRARTDPSDARAARFVETVSYGQRGHLRIAQTRDLDVIVYDSSRVLSWIVAYGRAHAGARLCLSGAGVAPSCFGTLAPGEDGTVNLSWSGRRDLAVFDTVSLRAAGGALIGRAPLVKRTG